MNKKIYEGKSRDIYQINDKEIVIVATDRISMHKVLPYLIKDKGIVLNKIAEFWFEKYKDIIGNHMITTDNKLMPVMNMRIDVCWLKELKCFRLK